MESIVAKDEIKLNGYLDKKQFRAARYNAIITKNSSSLSLINYITGSNVSYFQRSIFNASGLFEIADSSPTNKKVRVEITEAIKLAKKEGAVLVIAKLDRLARNVNFVSSLMDAGVEFIAVDMPSANNFTIHIFAALAEAEAKLISSRTKQALCELKKKGVKLGKPENLNNEARAKGVSIIKQNALTNDRNRQAQSIITNCKEKRMTYREIASYLNNLNFKTRYGKQFFAATVLQLYKRSISSLKNAA